MTAAALPRALRELAASDAAREAFAEPAAQQRPVGAPHVGEMAVCPECGPGVGFDEDGCCSTCGADTEAQPCKWAPVALDSALTAQPAPDLEAAGWAAVEAAQPASADAEALAELVALPGDLAREAEICGWDLSNPATDDVLERLSDAAAVRADIARELRALLRRLGLTLKEDHHG